MGFSSPSGLDVQLRTRVIDVFRDANAHSNA
jgi:hypothetical protein